jgi:hypothetical protein
VRGVRDAPQAADAARPGADAAPAADTAPAGEVAREAREFGATVDAAARRHPTADAWRPGAAASDANAALDEALSAAGWDDLAEDPTLLPFAAPAAVGLGRGFAPLRPVDRLLGGALAVDGLARYAAAGDRLVAPRAGRLELLDARDLRPVPYVGALGVAEVAAATQAGAIEGEEAEARMRAWAAASVGYLAGVTAEAVHLTVDHARSRIAFGAPLAALDPVQQMLADAAVAADGLELLAAGVPSLDALAHAGEAACRAAALCHQVTGGIGFTLEFPLQRAYRRARAAQLWADAALIAWEGPA